MSEHYKILPGGHEVIELRERWLPDMAEALGPLRVAAHADRALEYLLRAPYKDDPEGDLAKALNYLHRALYGEWFNPRAEYVRRPETRSDAAMSGTVPRCKLDGPKTIPSR